MKVEVESGSNANLISVSVPDYVADQSTKVVELNSLLVRRKYLSCLDNINNIVKGVNKWLKMNQIMYDVYVHVVHM